MSSEFLLETLSEEGFPLGDSRSCCPSSCCHELKKINGTPAGCPRDTRRDKQGSTGRRPRDFLLFAVEKLACLPGDRPGVPGTPGRPGRFQKFDVIFSYSGTKIQPKEEVFGRISLRTSGQTLRSGPPNPGKNKHFGMDMPRGRPRKNFGLKNFGLIFRSLFLCAFSAPYLSSSSRSCIGIPSLGYVCWGEGERSGRGGIRGSVTARCPLAWDSQKGA